MKLQFHPRTIPIVAAVCLNIFFFASSFAGNLIWTNTAGGDWNNATNWNPQQVPTSADTVSITNAGTYTITNSSPVDFLSFQLGGTNGTQTLSLNQLALTGANIINSNGVLNWSSGDISMNGSLTISNGGTLTVSNSITFGYDDGTESGGGALTNFGTVIYAPASLGFGYGGSVIVNAGLWEAASDNSLNEIGTNTFFNTGTLGKIAGAGTSAIQWTFVDTGITENLTGSFDFNWADLSTVRGYMNYTGNVNASVTVASNAVFNWISGDLPTGGSLTIAAGATLTVSNAITLGYDSGTEGGGGALTNLGTVIWAAASQSVGYGGSIIENDGLWNFIADSSLGSVGSNTFHNAGILEKTSGTGTSTIGWSLTGAGTVETITGSFSLNFAGNSTIAGSANLNSGTQTGSLTIASNAAINWTSGTIGGAIDVASNSVLNWSGDIMSNASLTISAGGTLSISNGITFGYDNGLQGGGGALTNFGTVIWAAPVQSVGYGGAVIDNEGLWDATVDSVLTAIGTNTFLNAGKLEKTGGSGSTTISWSFIDTGITENDSGMFNLNWSGISTVHGVLNFSGNITAPVTLASNAVFNWRGGDISSSGSLTVLAGSTLVISNSISLGYDNGTELGGGALTNFGTIVWASTVQSIGYGNSVIDNEGLLNMTVDNTLTPIGSNLFLNGGTLEKTGGTGSSAINWNFVNPGGTLLTTNDTFSFGNWTSAGLIHGKANVLGEISGTIAAGATLNWVSGDISSNVSITVATNGTLTISNSVTFGYDSGRETGGGALTNFGTVLWGTATASFGYGGSVIYNVGLWQSTGAGGLSAASGSNSFINAGTFIENAPGTTAIGWHFASTGTIHSQNGTLNLQDATESDGGLVELTGGHITFLNPYTFEGATLTGAGSVTGTITNNGSVSPGFPLGALSISGQYTQTTASALNIDLSGNIAGTSYDQLLVSGAAQLGGALNLSFTNGFIPVTSSNFIVLTAHPLTGMFGSFTYPSNFLTIQLNYTSTSVVAQILDVRIPPSPKTVFGPAIQGTNFVVRYQGSNGVTFAAQYTTNLVPANWITFTNVTAPSTDQGLGVGVFEVDDPIGTNHQRFYRLKWPAF